MTRRGKGHWCQALALLTTCWLLLATGCASPTPPSAATNSALSASASVPPPSWQGRLAAKVASDPPQAFSASFLLQGTAEEGQLALSSLLGTRVATLRWSAGAATLQTPQETLQFPSVDAMVAYSVGAPLPMEALFGWLQGNPSAPAGWAVDLQDLAAGRIRAWRLAPDAAAEIKLILEPG
jgi:outer membrane lipoprotein LolB